MRILITEANTGRPRCVVPPFLGEIPPTSLVPYSKACWLWKVPCLPVNPWHITRELAVNCKLPRDLAYSEPKRIPTEILSV